LGPVREEKPPTSLIHLQNFFGTSKGRETSNLTNPPPKDFLKPVREEKSPTSLIHLQKIFGSRKGREISNLTSPPPNFFLSNKGRET